jgi:hypothetical protein
VHERPLHRLRRLRAHGPSPDGLACDDGVACSTGDACRSGTCAAAGTACGIDSAWPSAGGDPRRAHARPRCPARQRHAGADGHVAGRPRRRLRDRLDGTIFATDARQVSTIEPDGATVLFAAVPATDLLLRQDGGLYATMFEGGNVLRALDADGAPRWAFDGIPVAAPAIGPSGAITCRAASP